MDSAHDCKSGWCEGLSEVCRRLDEHRSDVRSDLAVSRAQTSVISAIGVALIAAIATIFGARMSQQAQPHQAPPYVLTSK